MVILLKALVYERDFSGSGESYRTFEAGYYQLHPKYYAKEGTL